MVRHSLRVGELMKLMTEDAVGPNSDWNANFADDLRAYHVTCRVCLGKAKASSGVMAYRLWRSLTRECQACNGTGFADKKTHEEWVAHLFFCVVNKLNLHKSDLIAEVALLKDRLGDPPHA